MGSDTALVAQQTFDRADAGLQLARILEADERIEAARKRVKQLEAELAQAKRTVVERQWERDHVIRTIALRVRDLARPGEPGAAEQVSAAGSPPAAPLESLDPGLLESEILSAVAWLQGWLKRPCEMWATKRAARLAEIPEHALQAAMGRAAVQRYKKGGKVWWALPEVTDAV